MSEDGKITQPARLYRFGVFEADTATGELRRKGLRVKLNAQPFQVLLLLMDRPGQLLTREEISRELWPDGTFVDYEHGVNSAVNRIREAIGDSASNPRFIETLARRGYRFVAPVERIDPATTSLEPDSESANPNSQTTLTPGSPSQPEPEQESSPFNGILASPHELPKAPFALVQSLFVAMQLMYLAFYIGALTNLAEIEDLFSPLPRPSLALNVLIVTAGILIPVRAFVLTAALFHAPGMRAKFLKLWPFLLFFDVLWALAPFLLLQHINFGLALACTTLLVYSPFAQRSLVLMGAGSPTGVPSATAL